jgi:hypothetical protein
VLNVTFASNELLVLNVTALFAIVEKFALIAPGAVNDPAKNPASLLPGFNNSLLPETIRPPAPVLELNVIVKSAPKNNCDAVVERTKILNTPALAFPFGRLAPPEGVACSSEKTKSARPTLVIKPTARKIIAVTEAILTNVLLEE